MPIIGKQYPELGQNIEVAYPFISLLCFDPKFQNYLTKSGPLDTLIRMPIVQLSDKGFLHI